MPPEIPRLAAFAEALLDARRCGAPVARAAHDLPRDGAEGYAAQALVARRVGAEIAGWKVALADGMPVAAPLLGPLLHSGHCLTGGSGPDAVEVEIAFRLGRDLPPRDGGYAREEVVSAIHGVLVGIEIVASRLAEGAAAPFPAFLADNLGNAGFMAGEPVPPASLDRLAGLGCRVIRDGAVIHDATGGHPARDPLAPLLAWANAQCDALGGLRAGQVVTTGSLVGLLHCARPYTLEASIEGLGRLVLRA